MGKNKYLCPCLEVTKDDVKKAIKNGAGSFSEIQKETKIAKRCGRCECKVKKYSKKQLKKYAEKQK